MIRSFGTWLAVHVIAPVVVFVTERVFGWRTQGETPAVRKFLLLSEPHTSNLDLLVVFYWSCKIRRRVHYIIKAETRNWFLLGRFLRWTGAIFIDRDAPMSALKAILRTARAHEDFILLIAPSGTRKYTPGWKPGFHFIARKAALAIVPAGADYPTKRVLIGKALHPSKDVMADVERMRPFLEQITARHPEKASPIRLITSEDKPAVLV